MVAGESTLARVRGATLVNAEIGLEVGAALGRHQVAVAYCPQERAAPAPALRSAVAPERHHRRQRPVWHVAVLP